MIIAGITNRFLCNDFYNQIEKISKSNLNYLIIREKDLGSEDLLELCLKVKTMLRDTNIKIIINSNIEVAKKIDAFGVQLSFDNFVSLKIKKFKKIGVSIHSYEEGIRAYKMGADYLVYGHIFKTDCKKGIFPRGVTEIKKLSGTINIPIIAIGGINISNFKDAIRAGASGIAIMSSLMNSNHPKKLISKFLLNI